MRRLNIEYNTVKQNYSVTLVDNNIFNWRVHINSPQNGPYNGNVFVVNIEFPEKYPIESATIKFDSSIWHPHVNQKGEILELYKKWDPRYTIDGILSHLIDMLLYTSFEDAERIVKN